MSSCSESCGSTENMVMTMTMMSRRRRRRRRRGYLRTVIFNQFVEQTTFYCTAVFLYTVTQSTVCSGCQTAC
jgi:hypothetical protein